MVKVKICGITNIDDAREAVRAGCDALGFVFYKKSPRFITAQNAARITSKLPAKIKKIGVFVNAGEQAIKIIARQCALDMLQFHGDERPQFCNRFSGFKVIKAFRTGRRIDIDRIKSYHTYAYLFDTCRSAAFGGTGKKFDWSLLRPIRSRIKKPIFLSGGLNDRNVRQAIAMLHPDWVDVSSSVEMRPGRKSAKKISAFVKKAKSATEEP